MKMKKNFQREFLQTPVKFEFRKKKFESFFLIQYFRAKVAETKENCQTSCNLM